MEGDPLQLVVETLVEGVVVYVAPKPWVSLKTITAYGKTAVAAATALPVSLTFGGVLSLSQAQARPIEIQPHVLLQMQYAGPLETPRIQAAATSGGSSTFVKLTGHAMKSSSGRLITADPLRFL